MPVTIRLSDAPAATTTIIPAASPIALFRRACTSRRHKAKDNVIIQPASIDAQKGTNIVGVDNGLVAAVVRAFDGQHHLKLRPDDIWICILTQISACINATWKDVNRRNVFKNAWKDMRIMLNHEEIPTDGSTFFKGVSIDSNAFFKRLYHELRDNIMSPLQDLVFAGTFSTTLKRDRLAAAAIMNMAAEDYVPIPRKCPLPKECIARKNTIGPGFSSVTLLGDRADWKRLKTLVRNLLHEEGSTTETRAWYDILEPILNRMYLSFKWFDATETKDFWRNAAFLSGGPEETETEESGPMYLSGWITAFFFWDVSGNQLRLIDNDGLDDAAYTYFSPSEDFPDKVLTPILILDNIRYHRIDVDKIPPEFGSAAFKLKVPIDTEDIKMCMVTAGCVALEYSNSAPAATSDAERGHNAKFNTITPRCAWFVYETNTVKEARWDEEELFEQAFMKEHKGRSHASFGGKFRDESWKKVGTSTVMKILDDENLLDT